MFVSEKLLTSHNPSSTFNKTLFSPGRNNFNYNTLLTRNNLQSHNLNHTELNLSPRGDLNDLNASTQTNYNTQNFTSPLYNFRNRIGNSNNNISAFKTYNRHNKTISNYNNPLNNLSVAETINDFNSNIHLNLTNLNSSYNNNNNTNNNNTNNNNNIQKNFNLNSSNFIANNVTINNQKEENEKLKRSLNVLNKNNLDLKNQVRLLQIELSAVNTTTNFSFTNRVVDDPEIANFMENLKSALAQAQNSNSELCEMYENLQNKHMEISKEKIVLKEQYENIKNEFDILNKNFSENRLKLEENIVELRNCENERTNLMLQKNDFEEKFKLSEEKIENLLSINDNNLKCKSDNLEMIENLKNTISTLRKNNDIDNIKNELLKKLEYLENAVEEKDLSLTNMNQKLKNYEKDRDYYNQELKLMEKEFKDKQIFIEDLQYKYHEAITEVEKCKSRIEALNINLSERDQTINNLKTSMNFISGTLEDYKFDYEKMINQTDNDSSEKMKLIKELDLVTKKTNDLNDLYNELIADKESLQKRNIETERELNEKKNILTKLNFENDVLKQKIENNN